MNDSNVKQQIVDKIKSSTNILVTVSTNPSVDELSAALGLTILLNKMEKHATAVFSGNVPPAITFLDPVKTFENTVDSLRDFIIALDKEKADHLRYKVEGDVVKIFITPYRTTITSEDLDFSQGDYNVELVLALGVKKRDNLDQALAAHGRILHDATVVTIDKGSEPSDLGTIDWTEATVSSLSEMIVTLVDALKGEKPLLDEQIATALLTGIVAATDRFSNDQTSSRVMTMAAQLMGAGANQQLIAAKLEEAHEIGNEPAASPAEGSADGTTNLAEGEPTKLNKKDTPASDQVAAPKKDGELDISHELAGDVDTVAEATAEGKQEAAAEAATAELEKQLLTHDEDKELADTLASAVPAAGKPSVTDLQKDIAQASADVEEASTQPAIDSSLTLPKPLSGAVSVDQWKATNGEPSLGGTLNATAEEAAEEKRREEEGGQNHTILTHGGGNAYVGDQTPTFQAPLNAAVASAESEPPAVDVFKDAPSAGLPSDTQPTVPVLDFEPAPIPEPKHEETLADLDAKARGDHEDARAAVDAALGAQPFDPAGQPTIGIGAQPFGDDIPHGSTPAAPVVTSDDVSGTLPAPVPPLPPLPDFSTLPPLPGAPAPGATPSDDASTDTSAPLGTILSTPTEPNDPGQFKIPGQS